MQKIIIQPSTNQAIIGELPKTAREIQEINITVQKNAVLDYFLPINCSGEVNIVFTVNENAVLNTKMFYQTNNALKIKVAVKAKKNSKINYQSLSFARHKEKLQITEKIYLDESGADAQFQVWSFAKDYAFTQSNATIIAEKNAQNALGKLKIHSLTLGKNAIAVAVPALDTLCQNAILEHSFSASPFSAEDLFYLKSRGLPKTRAQDLIINNIIDSFNKKNL